MPPIAPNGSFDDYGRVRSEVTLGRAVPTAFPHFSLDVSGLTINNGYHLAPFGAAESRFPSGHANHHPGVQVNVRKIGRTERGPDAFWAWFPALGSLHLNE